MLGSICQITTFHTLSASYKLNTPALIDVLCPTSRQFLYCCSPDPPERGSCRACCNGQLTQGTPANSEQQVDTRRFRDSARLENWRNNWVARTQMTRLPAIPAKTRMATSTVRRMAAPGRGCSNDQYKCARRVSSDSKIR